MFIRKMVTQALIGIVFFGICSSYSSGIDLEIVSSNSKKAYPSSVALKIFTNLAAVVPLDSEEECSVHKTLLDFNQHIVRVLTASSEDAGLPTLLKREINEVIVALRQIKTDSRFGKKTQEIAVATEPELVTLSSKIASVEKYSDFKSLIVSYIPEIAAKEFLARNREIKEGNVHCDDCGLGYMRPRKSFKGTASLECKLCNHHQASPSKVTIRLVY